MKKLIWRIKFTLYGHKCCPIGWSIWWSWSDVNYDEYPDESPYDMAQEEIYAVAADYQGEQE